MIKTKVIGRVFRQDEIADQIYDMWIETELAQGARPGQFVCVYTKNAAALLPRPISICEVNEEKTMLRLVYRTVGTGTNEFAAYHAGTEISLLGPLGNGFPVEKAAGKRVFLIGGGIGIPPMLQLAKELDCEKSIVLGYRDELFLNEEFEPYGTVYLSSEDGMHGTKGNVIDAIKACAVTGDIIYACGPTPMLRGIKQYATEQNIRCEISLEEKMACGVGACLACVCQTKNVDEHSKVHNARICADGPVFYAEEVEL